MPLATVVDSPTTARPAAIGGPLRCALLGSAALLLAACGDAPDPSSGIVERDSAGVTIVENGTVSAGALFATVEPGPALEIGRFDGPPEYQLFRVVSAHRFDDGRLAIANAGSHEIRFYDADGRHLLSTGTEGEGPGEFGNIVRMWPVAGDSLYVFDSRNRSFSIFDAEGGFARSFPLGDEAAFRFPDGVLADGTSLVRLGRVFSAGEERGGLDRARMVFETYDPEGRRLAELGEWQGNEMFVWASDDRLAVRGLVFGRRLHASTSGERLVLGTSDEAGFELRDRQGRLERLVRIDEPARPVEAGAFDRLVEETLEESSPELEGMWRDMFAEMPRHETYPAFEDLATDLEGRIWLADYRAPGEEARWWSVFDGDGRALGRVRTPDGLRPLEIGPDYLIGVIQDELEVERIRLHGLLLGDRAVESAGGP